MSGPDLTSHNIFNRVRQDLHSTGLNFDENTNKSTLQRSHNEAPLETTIIFPTPPNQYVESGLLSNGILTLNYNENQGSANTIDLSSLINSNNYPISAS